MLAEVIGPKHFCCFDPLSPLYKLAFQTRAWIPQRIGFTRFKEPLPLNLHTVQQFNAVLMRPHNQPPIPATKQTESAFAPQRSMNPQKHICGHPPETRDGTKSSPFH